MSERYTIQGGLEHHLLERFGDNAKYALPLLILLIGFVILWAQHFNTARNAAKPFDLGIYTVKTSDGPNAGSKSNGGNKNGSGSANPLLSSANSTAPSSSGSSLYNLQGTSTSPTSSTAGGMGGGTLTSSSGTTSSSTLSATLQTPSLSVGSTSIGSTTTTIDPGVPKL